MALSWATAKETIKQYFNRCVVIFMKIRCFYLSPRRCDMVSLQVNLEFILYLLPFGVDIYGIGLI